ncbi:rab9 effector protein with kelch motifs isoform X2 [Denticeps clupeoides]|uniref:Rab9 effector protein with kelch motifs n=1 Tax=Denticeps clupeoides TaxID=299321 RepID=A0AAY4ATP2_9TELE|nr:rab9 effector protein with kelch motifs isoform X2 [Denticeps clupeoides]
MEVLPVLDPEDWPQEKQWYVLVPRGQSPGVSVGHTCTFLSTGEKGKGNILIVGGANPNGSFTGCQVLSLDRHEWDIPEWDGLLARYEHCSFVPESSRNTLWVFAGAEQSGNLNCLQVLHVADGSSWETVKVSGVPPSPRTYHTSSACVGDRLFVFSGGHAGASPVADSQLHVFDTVSSTWSQPDTEGTAPSSRHGHVVVAVGSTIYIHGGLSGDKFHSDMFSIDTDTMKWKQVQATGDVPPGLAAHDATALGKNIYIFGGMTPESATNSMYKFDTEEQKWTLIKFEGDLPPNRLDHSMCIVPWQMRKEGSGHGDLAHTPCSEVVNLCFIFGGMDTGGVIFNDCLVTVVS